MRNELYFCLNLTSNEHWVIENELKDFCYKHGLELVYYRELKEGHIPMYREVKVKGNIGYVRYYLKDKKLVDHIVPNPHREEI